MKKLALFFFVFGLIFSSKAQNTQALKLENIMKGKGFIGHWPDKPYWSFDSKTLYFQWNPKNEKIDSWYALDVTSSKVHKLSIEELKKRIPQKYEFNRTHTKVCFARNGDIFVYNLTKNKLRQIINTITYESSPVFSADGKKIFYQKDDNLFQWIFADGSTSQLTNIRKASGSRQSGAHKSEQEKWLENDRMQLFAVLRDREAIQKARTELRKKLKVDRPVAINIGNSRIFGIQISPDERFITFIKMQPAQSKHTEVPNYVTKSGYVENEKSRSKVGSTQASFRLVIFDRNLNKNYELKTNNISGINDWPKPYAGKIKGERGLTFSQLKYSPDAKNVLFVCRSQDNKDRWVLTLDLATGQPKVINRQTDSAWIGGPGIGNYWPTGNFGWMPDSKAVWYQSEKTGYSQLYVTNINTKKEKALTKGQFEVYEAQLSVNKTKWYLLTNQVHPGERQFYSMPLKGGKMTRLTQMTGYNESYLSPNEKQLALRYSYSNKPWEIYLKPNNSAAKAKQITHSQSEAYKAYSWRDPQVITFKAQDGEKVYARLYQPQKSMKNNAAIIFVHGAGYLQNADKYWSYYYREMMFHNLLADKGYTILDIDYRGSEGYGRDWRTGIYRHMGGLDLSDQVDGAKFLVEKYGINKNRIGIYGGSYGGFITLMAMFKAPGVFKCGAAIRSVTNWSNYNHGYTANILNTPVTDSVAYRQSSPIYFADGLKGHLLILHGIRDDNVHFQDVVDLNQRLIELGKKNWEMAIFPLERHGFKEASSWTDEYGRILALFEKELKK